MIEKTKIGLVQINNIFSGQVYFPYSTGLLQSYAQKHCSYINNYKFIDHIYNRLSVSDAIDHLKECNIIGFSIYVWNEQISLAIARKLKTLYPDKLIIFGGPQVPDKANQYLISNPFIDVVVHGEGEHVFNLILQHYTPNKLSLNGISGISYVENNKFINNPKTGRFKELNEIPSPYLTDIFQSIMDKKPNAQWLALWETNRGCPFSCTYCDWGSATQAKVSKFDINRLQKEIQWFSNNKVEFIFCCDANYGMLPRDIDITKYVVESNKKTGYPKALSVQNTKNATERSYQVQKILSDGGLNKGVTLSVQSMDKNTLINIKRDNISTESYQELQRRFMRDGIDTYSDMILALPGETHDSFVNGIDQIICNGQHNRIQFNNLSILPNAEMGNPEYQKEHGMKTVISDIINFHGSLIEDNENEPIKEKQELVISTNTMPLAEWIATRAYCWMVSFLHFDKIFQIPIILFHKQTNIKYRDIFSAFMDEKLTVKYPVLNELRQFFVNKAVNITEGGAEYCEAKDWLNIWWPADEYMFIKLVEDKKMSLFYEESHKLLTEISDNNSSILNKKSLQNAIILNYQLLKIPFIVDDVEISLEYDIMEFYKSCLSGDGTELNNSHTQYKIKKYHPSLTNWNTWLKEVVWYGNKKGAYLHENWEKEYQLSGHY